ncbi:MAG TPA: hypothetical protein VMH80_15560 [Bryobacteraceae bacterium]|nr:hypothetical protein [Bryobacteraceae bacterium]
MPALIVDNYDSFTYNLVHAVAEITGCAPIVVRNDELSWDDVRRLNFDSVIFLPGRAARRIRVISVFRRG